jgi:hypothetical protein
MHLRPVKYRATRWIASPTAVGFRKLFKYFGGKEIANQQPHQNEVKIIWTKKGVAT